MGNGHSRGSVKTPPAGDKPFAGLHGRLRLRLRESGKLSADSMAFFSMPDSIFYFLAVFRTISTPDLSPSTLISPFIKYISPGGKSDALPM